jgi:1-acyl-sn-glycerol-3-phosphate acyltransferase
MSTWLSDLAYESCYWLSTVGMTALFSLRTEGRRNVPADGPALLIANHQSFLDPILVGLCTRRHLYFLARKTLFRRPLFAALMRTLNAVPIDQEGVGKEGLKTILGELQKGHAVVVFPEGERTADGIVHALKPGIALLIKRVQAPIVPIGIAGAFTAWPRTRKYPIPAPLFLPAGRGTVAVSVGRRIDARRFAEMPRQEMLAELFVELQKVTERAERLRRKP